MERLRQSPDADAERYHAFDNLRGIMMMLLLILHTCASYMVTPLDTVWPLKDNSTHVVFDIAGAFIHTFRLPLFFVMAGFFGAKLYYERGTRVFLKNRTQRIGIPLIVFWVILAPLILAPFAFNHLDAGSRTFSGLVSWLVNVDVLSHVHFFHLWFLFDLLVYYGAMWLSISLLKLVGFGFGDRGRQKLAILYQTSWGPLTFVALTAISLLPMKLGMLETPATLARPPYTLLANAVFVLFGWGLHICRDSIDHFKPRAWTRTSIGVICFAAHLICVYLLLNGKSVFHLPSIVFAALSIWLLVYGMVGLFVQYLPRSNHVLRYIADSSYWCYLVHLPVVAWLSVLLTGWQVPAVLKFTVVLSVTALVCFLTYDLFVRSTSIGVLINGRRRPSRFTQR